MPPRHAGKARGRDVEYFIGTGSKASSSPHAEVSTSSGLAIAREPARFLHSSNCEVALGRAWPFVTGHRHEREVQF